MNFHRVFQEEGRVSSAARRYHHRCQEGWYESTVGDSPVTSRCRRTWARDTFLRSTLR